MAISAASYSVGNRVYKGGSNAPTRGTVDPMGYIDRGLNAPSQSRSGIAQAALSRIKAPAKPKPVQPVQPIQHVQPVRHVVTPTGQLARPAPYANNPSMGGNRALFPGLPATDSGGMSRPPMDPNVYVPHTNAGPSTVGPNDYTQGSPVTNAGTPIEGNNQFTQGAPRTNAGLPIGQETIGNTAVPYDHQAAQAEEALNAQKDARFNSYNTQLQGVEEDYTNQRRGEELRHPDVLRNLLNAFNARGLANSSGYGYGLGQSEDNYANTLGGIDRQHTRQVVGIGNQRNEYNAGYAADLQRIKAAAIERLAAQAGDLGLEPPTTVTASTDPVYVPPPPVGFNTPGPLGPEPLTVPTLPGRPNRPNQPGRHDEAITKVGIAKAAATKLAAKKPVVPAKKPVVVAKKKGK